MLPGVKPQNDSGKPMFFHEEQQIILLLQVFCSLNFIGTREGARLNRFHISEKNQWLMTGGRYPILARKHGQNTEAQKISRVPVDCIICSAWTFSFTGTIEPWLPRMHSCDSVLQLLRLASTSHCSHIFHGEARTVPHWILPLHLPDSIFPIWYNCNFVLKTSTDTTASTTSGGRNIENFFTESTGSQNFRFRRLLSSRHCF